MQKIILITLALILLLVFFSCSKSSPCRTAPLREKLSCGDGVWKVEINENGATKTETWTFSKDGQVSGASNPKIKYFGIQMMSLQPQSENVECLAFDQEVYNSVKDDYVLEITYNLDYQIQCREWTNSKLVLKLTK